MPWSGFRTRGAVAFKSFGSCLSLSELNSHLRACGCALHYSVHRQLTSFVSTQKVYDMYQVNFCQVRLKLGQPERLTEPCGVPGLLIANIIKKRDQ